MTLDEATVEATRQKSDDTGLIYHLDGIQQPDIPSFDPQVLTAAVSSHSNMLGMAHPSLHPHSIPYHQQHQLPIYNSVASPCYGYGGYYPVAPNMVYAAYGNPYAQPALYGTATAAFTPTQTRTPAPLQHNRPRHLAKTFRPTERGDRSVKKDGYKKPHYSKRLPPLNTEEEIKRWVEERKKRYPTLGKALERPDRPDEAIQDVEGSKEAVGKGIDDDKQSIDRPDGKSVEQKCRFFKRGRCKYGHRCKLSHDPNMKKTKSKSLLMALDEDDESERMVRLLAHFRFLERRNLLTA